MSIFPKKLDNFPTIYDIFSSKRRLPAKNKLPDLSEFMGRIYSALENIEQHIGVGVKSGGDILCDSTVRDINPGRIISLQQVSVSVPSSSDRQYQFFLNWSDLFSDKVVLKSSPNSCPLSDIPQYSPNLLRAKQNNQIPAIFINQNPLVIKAIRYSYPSSRLVVSPFINSNVVERLAITQPIKDVPFLAGEKIQIAAFFYGGL